MKPVGVGKPSTVATQKPATAGQKTNPVANAEAKLQANLTRLKDNAHAVAGLTKALDKVKANAARFAAKMGDKSPAKTDLGTA